MSSHVQTYRRGVAYAVLAGVFLSTAGLMVRYLGDIDPWVVLFYRSLAFFVTVTVFMACSGGPVVQRFRLVRRFDLVVTATLAAGFIFYLLSPFHTSVANTVLLLSTGPFLAAVFGRLLLGESVSAVTWLAMLVAMCGVITMMSHGLSPDDRLGMIYAVAAVVTFACMVVSLRHAGAERDMLPAIALAGVVAAAVSAWMVNEFDVTGRQLLLSLLLGSVQVGCGFILITLATRSVPAAQVPLLALGETALAPLWVWLLVNEIPSANTLLGGMLVISAVFVQGWYGWRSSVRSL